VLSHGRSDFRRSGHFPRSSLTQTSTMRAVIEELEDMLSPDHVELSTINGMHANGSHPRVIANESLADRT